MSPASTLRYGSILIAVAFNPIVFSSRPVDEAMIPLPLQVTVSKREKVDDHKEFKYTTILHSRIDLHATDDTTRHKDVFHLEDLGCGHSQQGQILRSGQDEGPRRRQESIFRLRTDLTKTELLLV